MGFGGVRVPVYEKIDGGSSNSLFVGEGTGLGAMPRRMGDVLAWCLTISALLATAGTTSQVAAFRGVELIDRMAQFALSSLYPSALVLGAVVALRLTRAGAVDRGYRGITRACAVGSLAVCAAMSATCDAYTIVRLLTSNLDQDGGIGSLDLPTRLVYVGVAVAAGFMSLVAIYALVRRPAPVGSASEGDVHGNAALGAFDVRPPSRRVLDPVVACLFAASVVLIVRVMIPVFSTGGESVNNLFDLPRRSLGDRVSDATAIFNGLPLALAMLAIVVLVAASGPREPRNRVSDLIATVVGFVGVVAAVSAVYEVFRALTVDAPDARGLLTFVALGGWGRASIAATALAAGVLGAAAVYLSRQLPSTDSVDGVVIGAGFDPRTVGIGFVIAALGAACYIVTPLLSGPGFAVGDVLLLQDTPMLLAVGLALAAVIVMASSRRVWSDATGRARDRLGIVIDAIAAAIGLATLATNGFVIVYVLVPHDVVVDNRFGGSVRSSIIAGATGSAKVAYVAVAIAGMLVAAGLLHFIWSAGRSRIDDEPVDSAADSNDEIPVVDLLP